MFGAVMVNEEICRDFLEMAVGFPIEKVEISKEKSMIYHPEYRGIRLDIIARDENRTHYNVEMQVAKKSHIGKRARYYHSQMDMELLLTGEDYRELPAAYVIFICDFDPFGQKKYRYTFENICAETGLSIADGSTTIFCVHAGIMRQRRLKNLLNFLNLSGLTHQTVTGIIRTVLSGRSRNPWKRSEAAGKWRRSLCCWKNC